MKIRMSRVCLIYMIGVSIPGIQSTYLTGATWLGVGHY